MDVTMGKMCNYLIKTVEYKNFISKEVELTESGTFTTYFFECPKCMTVLKFENEYIKPMKMRQMARLELILCCACMNELNSKYQKSEVMNQ